MAEGLFGYKLDRSDLPCPQTVLNIISEEGAVLSELQLAERIMESTNITLHTDGTSRQKKTFIGQQLTLDSGATETLSLGVRTVAT